MSTEQMKWGVFEKRFHCLPERVGFYSTELEAQEAKPRNLIFGREECRITYTVEETK
jgi:hypothetical protein